MICSVKAEFSLTEHGEHEKRKKITIEKYKQEFMRTRLQEKT